jgi:hypothetical protein
VEFPGENIVQASKIMVETNTSLGETVGTSNVEEMAKVVQDVSAASTNQVSTAEEVAKRVDEGEIANFMDEKRRAKVSELETDEQVAFSLQEKEKKELMQSKCKLLLMLMKFYRLELQNFI